MTRKRSDDTFPVSLVAYMTVGLTKICAWRSIQKHSLMRRFTIIVEMEYQNFLPWYVIRSIIWLRLVSKRKKCSVGDCNTIFTQAYFSLILKAIFFRSSWSGGHLMEIFSTYRYRNHDRMHRFVHSAFENFRRRPPTKHQKHFVDVDYPHAPPLPLVPLENKR